VTARDEGAAFAARVIFLPLENSNSTETLVHEWAHAFVLFYNDALRPSQQRVALAFQEGMADVIQGLYGEISSNKGKFGDAFVIGDGTTASPISRTGKTNRMWQDITDTALFPNFHDAGQVFYNFFFRVKQLSPNVSFERLLGVLWEQ
jgi:hypothetical protein